MSKNLQRKKKVCERTTLPPSTLYELIAAGEFPRPVKISARSVAWRESEVDEWIESREVA